jgi:hypothetical protein
MKQLDYVRRTGVHHAAFEFKRFPIVTMADSPEYRKLMKEEVVALIRHWHVDENGWSDIGYHWIIGNGHGIVDGGIVMGRLEKYQGAHIKRNNHDSLGILLMGDLRDHPPTDKQVAALINLLTNICFRYNLDPTAEYSRRRFGKVGQLQEGFVIDGHNSWPGHKSHSCPGMAKELLPDIRNNVDALMDSVLFLVKP